MSDDDDESFDLDDDFDDFEDVPLPARLSYLDRAARQVVRPEWIGHPPWKPPHLAKADLDALAKACAHLKSKEDEEPLHEWVHHRMSEESLSNGKLEPTGGRIYGLIMLMVVLAEAKIEPFASLLHKEGEDRPSLCGFTNSVRSEYHGPPAICEATQSDPAECTIPTNEPDFPYVLSHPAADRLEHRCLPPIEWYRLVVLHGRPYHLWGDFYGNEGQPYQATFAVQRSYGDGIPTFEQVRDDLSQLLDFAFFNLLLDQEFKEESEVMDALAGFGRQAVEAALDRRAARRNVEHVRHFCWTMRIKLGYVDEARLRQRWADRIAGIEKSVSDIPWLAKDSVAIIGAAPTIDLAMDAAMRLENLSAGAEQALVIDPHSISFALRDRMGSDMLLELVLWLIERVPAANRGQHFLSLADFHDQRVLDWIERHMHETPGAEHTAGAIAAVNELSWSRACKWLAAGRPLSLVALDAMKNCRGFDPDDRNMYGIFRNNSPKIGGGPSRSELKKELEAYLQRDPDQDVRDAITVILANSDKIFTK